jgi:adenosylcobinamide kinase/adenosylcobinamide-phosphate guanylyltransferase
MAADHERPVRFIATARAGDDEMRQRIERHRAHRPPSWTVVEEPIELSGAIRDAAVEEVLVIDCVTLWISNLMMDRDDPMIFELVDEAVDLAAGHPAPAIVVSNEVGSGLVPMDPIGRRFRDLQGWANQRFAAAAQSAYLVVAGHALRLEVPGDAG